MADIVIRNKLDVTDFLSNTESIFEVPKDSFVIRVVDMSPDAALKWEDRLNRAHADCG